MMIAASAAVLALSGCQKEIDSPQEHTPLTFRSTIGSSTATRAYDATWESDDAIGVYMTGAEAGDRINVKHVTTGNGDFTAAVASEAIYLPENSNAVAFKAYYPYVAGITDEYAVNVASQSDLSAIDLLYSDNVTNYTTGNKPNLTFTHMLTKVVFNINDQRTGSSLTGATVTLKGLNTNAVFNLANGTMSSTTTPADIAANMVSISGARATAEAIILPGIATSYDIEVSIPADGTLNPSSYTLTAQNYQPGQKHIYILNIIDSGTPEMILVDGTGTIVNWNEETHTTPIVIDKSTGTSPAINIAEVATVAYDAQSVDIEYTIENADGSELVVTKNEVSASWIGYSQGLSSPGSLHFLLFGGANGNTSGANREATFTLTYGEVSKIITIRQLARPTPVISLPDGLTYNVGAAETRLEVEYTVSNTFGSYFPQVGRSSDWITSASAPGQSGGKLVVVMKPNDTGAERRGNITISYYLAETVTFTVVQAGTVAAAETVATLDFPALCAAGIITNASGTSDAWLQTFTYEGVTLTPSQGSHSNSAPRYWDNGSAPAVLRTYSGNTLTFTVPAGKQITKIDFTNTSASGSANGFTVDTGTLTGFTSWTGASNAVTLTTSSSGQHHFAAITVTYK